MLNIRSLKALLISTVALASLSFETQAHIRSARHPHSIKATPKPVVARKALDAASTVKDFEQWLTAVEQSGQISGMAVTVVDGNQILLQRGIGYANAITREPVTGDTVFRLASLSKAFATTLAGLLIEEGMLSWDTHVSDVLPTFTLHDENAGQQLTVRNILSQRVGLPHNTYDRLLEADEPYPMLVEKLKEVPLSCPVGDCYGYQNVSFSLIGDITYAATGDFFYHQVEKRIFHPLAMSTATYGRNALESSASWARPHTRRGNTWIPFEPRESYYHVPPAAGVNASIKDMGQWLIAQMGGRPNVLTPALLEELHTPQVATPNEGHSSPWRRTRVRDAKYAIGWRVYDYAGESLLFHAGAVQGYRAMVGFFPKYRFGAVLLWNCECSLPAGMLPMLLDRYLGMPSVDWAGVDSIRSTNVGLAASSTGSSGGE